MLIFGGGDGADQVTRSGQRTFVSGSTDLGRLLPDEVIRHRLVVNREFFTRPRPLDFNGYPVIANMITEAERSGELLRNVQKLLNGYRGHLLNPPAAVLRTRRDEVAQMLAGIEGLLVPAVVRLQGGDPALSARALEEAGIVPPVIVRETGTHTGQTVRLCHTIAEAADGLDSGKEYIATQFVDFASADGLYRKYRVYFIGQGTVLRHMYVSDHWNVHSADRARFMGPRPEVIAEERALIERAQPFDVSAREVFSAVRERMPLDFFGLDFARLPDGRVLLFEANATMSFFPLWRDSNPEFQYLTQCLPPARTAFMEMVGMTVPDPIV
ncbi:MAG: hypothetical protein HOQ20_08010 [Bradyrhizobium sp.]|nr:hypothetical protein [Bradyrhizobium sp.]